MKRERADRETTQESILNLPSICLPGWNIAGETFQTGVSSPFLSLSLSSTSSNRQTVLLPIFFTIFYTPFRRKPKETIPILSFFFSYPAEELIKPFTILLESGRNGKSRERREKDRRARYLEGNGMTGIGH